MKNRLALFLFVATLWLATGPAHAIVAEFDTVTDAHNHCPYDTIVHIDNKNAASPGQGGRQPAVKGGYVCKNEAVYGGYGGLITHLKPVPQPAR